jgi:hypothetical protein
VKCNNRLLACLWVGQLIAAIAICVNHFSFSLLKGLSFSKFWESQPTMLGISFLALSAGFLAQADGDEGPAISILAGRFLRIAVPTYIAVAIDIAFLSDGRMGGGSSSSWWPLLSVLTLTQTWSYNVFGAGSLPLPLGMANLVWVGSCLFGLYCLRAVGIRFWRGLGPRASLTMLIVYCLGCFAYFALLHLKEIGIQVLSDERFGQMLLPYHFLNWLYAYSPFSEAGPYFAGVCLAQWLVRSKGDVCVPHVVGVLLLGIALIVLSSTPFPAYLGINLIVVLGAAAVTTQMKPIALNDLLRLPTFKYLTPVAFEIVIFHIMFYELFPLRDNTAGWEWLVARVIGVDVLMVLVFVITNFVLIFPLLRLFSRVFELPEPANRHL